MTYVDHNYGNHIQFTDKDSKKKRAIALRDDKNRIVYAAAIYRKRWGDIKEFKDYQFNTTDGDWIITITATPGFHDRFLKLLNDPKTLESFFSRLDHWKKRYHRMAKRHAVKREDADPED